VRPLAAFVVLMLAGQLPTSGAMETAGTSTSGESSSEATVPMGESSSGEPVEPPPTDCPEGPGGIAGWFEVRINGLTLFDEGSFMGGFVGDCMVDSVMPMGLGWTMTGTCDHGGEPWKVDLEVAGAADPPTAGASLQVVYYGSENDMGAALL
jgi:hypothetical protein